MFKKQIKKNQRIREQEEEQTPIKQSKDDQSDDITNIQVGVKRTATSIDT